ncbi:MAG: PEP-CTERM sorting domain-containing protein [Zoogloea sp.]|nr:PEP-CTERM sorting domain-containing protein [Zoogloea sp.]
MLFFESQPNDWGLELRGGLNGAATTTALTDRLYTLVDYATPDDDRLTSIRGRVPEPGMLPLLGAALLGAFGFLRRTHR